MSKYKNDSFLLGRLSIAVKCFDAFLHRNDDPHLYLCWLIDVSIVQDIDLRKILILTILYSGGAQEKLSSLNFQIPFLAGF